MNHIKRFHVTHHASGRVNERSISLEQVKMVQYPEKMEKQRRGNNGGYVHRFEKRYNNQVCVVVAEVHKNECWIITSYIQ